MIFTGVQVQVHLAVRMAPVLVESLPLRACASHNRGENRLHFLQSLAIAQIWHRAAAPIPVYSA